MSNVSDIQPKVYVADSASAGYDVASAEKHLALWYAANRDKAAAGVLVHYDTLLSGCCMFPDCAAPGELRRQLCAYSDDIQNFASYCEPHQAETDELWNEQWDEYYAAVRP